MPTEPQYAPTCSTKPMAGIWIWDEGPTAGLSPTSKGAVARAMKVNMCGDAAGVDLAKFDEFPIGGGNPPNTCQKIRGCPDAYPLVVCRLPGPIQSSHDSVANSGFSTFVKLFSAPPLLTP